MSDAYLNLIKAAKECLAIVKSAADGGESWRLEKAIEAAEKEIEPWQKEQSNGD